MENRYNNRAFCKAGRNAGRLGGAGITRPGNLVLRSSEVLKFRSSEVIVKPEIDIISQSKINRSIGTKKANGG